MTDSDGDRPLRFKPREPLPRSFDVEAVLGPEAASQLKVRQEQEQGANQPRPAHKKPSTGLRINAKKSHINDNAPPSPAEVQSPISRVLNNKSKRKKFLAGGSKKLSLHSAKKPAGST